MQSRPTSMEEPHIFYDAGQGRWFCTVDRTAIILDLDQDRYRALKLPPDAEGMPDGETRALWGERPTMRFIKQTLGKDLCAHQIARVTQEHEPDTDQRPGPGAGSSIAAMTALLAARFSLRWSSFGEAVLALPESGYIPEDSLAPEMEAILASHRRALRHFPSQVSCVPNSLALAVRLKRAGVACHFVIGVRLDPFAAHAWVQRRGMVLNDRTEMISIFRPIFAR